MLLPVCPEGYGNMVDLGGSLCQQCATGTYSNKGSSGPCQTCEGKPSNSHYTSTTKGPNCPYKCDQGYFHSNDDCLSPLDNFIFNYIGVPGFCSCIAFIVVLIIAPLAVLKVRRRYGRFYFTIHGINKRSANTKTNAPPASHATTQAVMQSSNVKFTGAHGIRRLRLRNRTTNSSRNSKSKLSKSNSISLIEDPLLVNLPVRISKDGENDFGDSLDDDKRQYTFFDDQEREKRLMLRLTDPDMPFHACRIYLFGSNHPYSSYGS
jgi:hypothetical protein